LEEKSISELEHYIRSSFGIINSRDLQTIASLFKMSSLKKGEYLLQEGHRCTKLSFVQSGLLRMYRNTENKEVTQWISTKGSFSLDLASFIFEKPARLSIQALVDTVVFSISKEDYGKLGDMLSKWHELEKLFLANCFITLEERVISHLAMTAEERYEHFFESHKELFNQVPLQYIASMLGMTAETFSRIRKKQ
tara:strand:- start:964 stop:1545 length:582 start_codon:yes stop_codon:yes gene_type:complete